MTRFVNRCLEKLARSILSRNNQRALFLDKSDNAIIIRQGDILPIFAAEDTERSRLGALYVVSLFYVATDITGETNFRQAVDTSLDRCGEGLATRVKFERLFDDAMARS